MRVQKASKKEASPDNQEVPAAPHSHGTDISAQTRLMVSFTLGEKVVKNWTEPNFDMTSFNLNERK